MNRKFQNYILYILYEEKKYTINILYFFCFRVVALPIILAGYAIEQFIWFKFVTQLITLYCVSYYLKGLKNKS